MRPNVRRDVRCARERGVPRGPSPALNGGFLLQRAGEDSRDQAEGRGARAEGDPRAGIAQGMRRKGRGGGGGAGIDAARGGHEDSARRIRRDACLYGIPAGALAPYQDEQRDRAYQPRDREEDEGRRDLSGQQLGPHAGKDEVEAHSRSKRRYPDMSKLEEMDELRGKAEGQKRTGPRPVKSICERFLTAPQPVLFTSSFEKSVPKLSKNRNVDLILSHARDDKVGIVFLVYVQKDSFIKQLGENYCASTSAMRSLACPSP